MQPNQQPAARKSVAEYYREWRGACPAFTAYIVISCIVVWILSIPFAAEMLLIFPTIPYFVVFKFQMWRMLLSEFYHSNIFSLVFCMLAFYPQAKRTEAEEGSVKFFVASLIFMASISNLLFVVLCTLLALNPLLSFPMLLLSSSAGLWPVVMIQIVSDCFKDPERPRQVFFLPFTVPAKWYPLVLFALFSILFGIQLDFLVGICIGFLKVTGKLKWLSLSDDRVLRMENAFPFKYMLSLPGFVQFNKATGAADLSSSSASGGSAGSSNTIRAGHIINGPSASSASASASASVPEGPPLSVKPFSGKGFVLGSSNHGAPSGAHSSRLLNVGPAAVDEERSGLLSHRFDDEELDEHPTNPRTV